MDLRRRISGAGRSFPDERSAQTDLDHRHTSILRVGGMNDQQQSKSLLS